MHEAIIPKSRFVGDYSLMLSINKKHPQRVSVFYLEWVRGIAPPRAMLVSLASSLE
jgi:hypothetical protein